ncbi:MAG: hypothetical protein KatS3mg108_1721 [Isosphaeraceae bacterium]|nr:MAG: hypothetical protein KatS3mg108_1721 [Isosphaeraceae bacterium]
MSSLRLLLVVLVVAGPAAAGTPTLLDFTASWCGPCRATRPEVEKLKQQGYPVREIDVDEQPELARRYGVSAVPTFIVVDGDGRAVARDQGAKTAAELAQFYDSAVSVLEARTARRGPEAADSEVAGRPKPWETVVRIKVENHLSRPRPTVGFGSGTIIHSTPEESIILTCAHIFHVEQLRKPVPPSEFPLRVKVDLFDGRLSGGRTPQVHTTEVDIPAEVIDYDFAGDVALIRIRPGRRLPASPVVDPGWTPQEGMKLTTLGCSHGQDATAWSTRVTRPLIRLQTPRGLYSATECLYPPMQGRSGGGLFTLDGLLVGVCDFNDGDRGRHGLYASPSTIHRLLERNQLQVAYASNERRNALTRQLARDDRSEDVKARFNNSPLNPDDEIPLPSPEVLNVRIPGEQQAAALRRDSYRWRGRDEAPASAIRSVRLGSPEYDGTPRTANLQVDPAATGDLFSAAPDAEPTDARSPGQVGRQLIPPARTKDAWLSGSIQR